MKHTFKIYFIIITLFCYSCNSSVDTASEKDNELMVTFEDSLSYAMGVNIGKNIPDYEINSLLLINGLNDYLSDKNPKLDSNARSEILRAFNIISATQEREKMLQMTEIQKELSRTNKMKGKAFADKNKLTKGVKVLKRSGVQYRVINQGDGPRPDYNDSVVVHYNGYLVDGHKFDSSYDKGKPMTMKLTQFIPGWQEILQIMTVGSKWEVVIPDHLAYGKAGIPANREEGIFVIPPSATLVFEIELLDIIK